MSPTITVTGLGSGIDLSQIVDQLVLLERHQINRLEIWKDEWEDKIESIQGLNSRLLSLESFVTDYNTETEFLATTATSSNEDVLTVSSDSSATTGAYDIEVATSTKHRLGSEGKASKTVTYAEDTEILDITVAGVTDRITFSGNCNLDTMVTQINLGTDLVEAEVIDDGSGENEFRLVLTANSAGSSNTISTSNNGTEVDFSMSGAGDRIDDVEYSSTWSGSPPADNLSSGGQYLGTTNKTFRFTISGSDTYELGHADTGSFDVTWTDGEGNGGTISVTDTSYTNLDVFQGVTISFGDAGQEVVGGETFSVDVWHPDLQAGQDDGLAKVEKEVHSGFSDTDTTAVTSVGGGDKTFSYTYNGQEIDVAITAGSTLSELKGLINNDSNNPGVTASIINDGSGLSTAYHLVLTGNNTGAAYKITSISHTLDNADFDNTFTEAQAAQNAMIKVDSYPSGSQYIQKSSNSISDVIGGVTLSLVDDGSATVSISEDLDTIRTNIETFVNGVNFLLDYIKKETGYDEDTGEAGVMLMNYSYRIVQARINQILTNAIPGLTDGVDTYVHLAQIGIKTNPDEDGKWEIDSTTLNNALSADLEAVSKLFIKDEVVSTNGVYELLSQELEDLTDSEDGPMNVLIDNYYGIIDGIDTKIEREERRVALVEARLTEQFVRLEVLLGQLSGQESYLLSLIESLPTIGGKD